MECEICAQGNPPEARFCANCGAALVTTVKQPLPAAPEPLLEPAVAVEYMGFWIRFGAAIIDAIVVWFLISILNFFISLLRVNYTFFTYSMVSLVGPLLYYWLFTGLKGQTLGKMLVGIKVVNTQGDRPGLASAALREIPGKIISAIVFCLGFLWIAWDMQKQGWHDKLAATYVLKVETRR